MADSINFNIAEGNLAGSGVVVYMFGPSGDMNIDQKYYFVGGGKTVELIHETSISGLQMLFPRIHVKHFEWEGIKEALEIMTAP